MIFDSCLIRGKSGGYSPKYYYLQNGVIYRLSDHILIDVAGE